MNIVNEIIDPGPSGMLIHTHGPERGHFLVGVPVKRGHIFYVFGGDTGYLFNFLRSVIIQKPFILLKIDRFGFVFELEMVFGAIADVGFALVKGYVLVYKAPVYPLIADDLITDGVGHG